MHAPTTQAPRTQVTARFGGGRQGLLHAPQWATLLPRITVSQPVSAIPSQSPRPASQTLAQVPATHARLEKGGGPKREQSFPQAPQFARSVRGSTHAPAQIARGGGQTSVDTIASHPFA